MATEDVLEESPYDRYRRMSRVKRLAMPTRGERALAPRRRDSAEQRVRHASVLRGLS